MEHFVSCLPLFLEAEYWDSRVLVHIHNNDADSLSYIIERYR